MSAQCAPALDDTGCSILRRNFLDIPSLEKMYDVPKSVEAGEMGARIVQLLCQHEAYGCV